MRGIRSDVVEALRAIAIPNLRWPGGCFADDYHWRDGIGPRESRPRMVNSHWGDVVEDNAFGTHEFMDLCELLGADPYVSGNVGSGSVAEMSRVGRVPDPGGRLTDGGAAAGERARAAVAGAVLGPGQRGVGLRRQPARRAVRVAGPAVRDLLPQPRRQPAVPDRGGRERGRPALDRDAHALVRRPGRGPGRLGGPVPGRVAALLHDGRAVVGQGRRHRSSAPTSGT